MPKQSIGARAPRPMIEQIEVLVEQGKYLNPSDFLRSAIRGELEKHKEEE